ncbi:MAG: glutamine synthetase type III, partial [Spirochaetia bacterium]|nr:glutamine synthetase type III [Spirochaetia bacterium]
ANFQFLLFLTTVIKAVYEHSTELRVAIATAGNDHRLGANEAPPAIISVFLGDLLSRVLHDLEKGVVTETKEKAWLSIGIDKIPTIPRDNTDRNRTSPFAFTGNKFEFRAVGGNQTPSTAITVLNSAVAAKLTETKEAIDAKMKSGADFNSAVVETIREMFKASKNILFEGDNYSKEWEKEAEKRGLPNLKATPEALETILKPSTIKLFESLGIYSKRELESRYIINMSNYIKQIDIEARVGYNMAMNMYLPAAIRYSNELLTNVQLIENVLGNDKAQTERKFAAEIVDLTAKLNNESEKLNAERLKAEDIIDMKKAGEVYKSLLLQLNIVRDIVDKLEDIIPHETWPAPKYREMLLGL